MGGDPQGLNYLNESMAGPLHGADHLLGINADWGQDVLYCRNWLEDQVRPVGEITKGSLQLPLPRSAVEPHAE